MRSFSDVHYTFGALCNLMSQSVNPDETDVHQRVIGLIRSILTSGVARIK